MRKMRKDIKEGVAIGKGRKEARVGGVGDVQ